MDNWIILLLMALGLAMDAFAVSICNGLSFKGIKKRQILFIALIFGLMQGLMPILGYYLGSIFKDYIASYQKWISFGLLLLIGLKMFIEGIKSLRHPDKCDEKKFSYKSIILQGIATSIDALAVGITLGDFTIDIYTSASTIASITFLVALVGVLIGVNFGKLLKNKSGIADIIGGLILIGIGISFLFK